MKQELPMPVVIAIVALVILAVIAGGVMYVRSWDKNPAPPKSLPTAPPSEKTQTLAEPEV